LEEIFDLDIANMENKEGNTASGTNAEDSKQAAPTD